MENFLKSRMSEILEAIFSKTKQGTRQVVVSREAKKKQHAHASSGLDDHYSELFTQIATLKL